MELNLLEKEKLLGQRTEQEFPGIKSRRDCL